MSRLQDVLLRGLASARPAASAVANGTLYFATDTTVITQSDGSTWNAYSAAAATPGIVLIEEKVCSGSTSSETFSSIPGTYRHLRILYTARVTSTGSANHDVYIQCNGDTAANYNQQLVGAFSGTPIASATIGSATPMIFQAPEASATAGLPGVGECVVPYYAGTTFHKTITSVATARSANTAVGGIVLYVAVHWNNTAAITSLRLAVVSSGNFASGTKFSLYGVS